MYDKALDKHISSRSNPYIQVSDLWLLNAFKNFKRPLNEI